MSTYIPPIRPDELMHFGVLGMKWGIRRYQPYSYTGGRKGGKGGKEIGEAAKLKGGSNGSSEGTGSAKRKGLSDKQKKAIKKGLKIGATVAGTALAAYGGYKLSQYIKSDKEKWDQVRKFAKDYADAKEFEDMAWSNLQDVGRKHGTKSSEWAEAEKTWQFYSGKVRGQNYKALGLKDSLGSKKKPAYDWDSIKGDTTKKPNQDYYEAVAETEKIARDAAQKVGIKLEWGWQATNTADKGNDYTDRILKTNQSLGDIAKSAKNKVGDTTVEDFTAELLNKASKKLK